ncbi:hypothetical protein [Methylophilus sp. Leaf414]|uniref:hypothetical protein n=1 Tax=Methylophilus sp. Leaf414 TaxID=1736371 RepID=UPI0006FDE86F|nr:hypothetical protein [Methylophilus sp. Leaf414]KQT38209.1 hypothetical protein ASG24_04450 [Methylophilus sp. Leaf414]
MTQVFQIFRVAALTQTPGMEDDREETINLCYQVIKFLQDNDLLLRTMAKSIEDINDDFVLMSTDLTEDGVDVMKAAFYKWLKKTDTGMPPEDTTLLIKALNKVRSKS